MTQDNFLVSPTLSACLKCEACEHPAKLNHGLRLTAQKAPHLRPSKVGDTAVHVAQISQSASLNRLRIAAVSRKKRVLFPSEKHTSLHKNTLRCVFIFRLLLCELCAAFSVPSV